MKALTLLVCVLALYVSAKIHKDFINPPPAQYVPSYRVLITALPQISHVGPQYEIAAALQRSTKHIITLATHADFQSIITNKKVYFQQSFNNSNSAIEQYASAYDALLPLFENKKTVPEFVVADSDDFAVIDLCTRFNVRMVTVALHSLPDHSYIGKWIIKIRRFLLGEELTAVRKSRGNTNCVHGVIRNATRIATSFLGFERPRPVSPLVQYVGFFHEDKFETEVYTDRPLNAYLDFLYKNGDEFAIYVAIGQVDEHYYDTIIPGILKAVPDALIVLELPSRDDPAKKALTARMFSNVGRVRIETKANRKMILKNPAIRAFVTDGDVDAIADALTFGQPMVFVPMNEHQRVNADYAVDNGVGALIGELNAQNVGNVVKNVLKERNNMIDKEKRLLSLSKAQGGAFKAAEIIASTVLWGDDHLKAGACEHCSMDSSFSITVSVAIFIVSLLLFFRNQK
jgi:hypothetical protein